MKIRVVPQLLQHEVSNASTCDFSFDLRIGYWEAMSIDAGSLAVLQMRGANDGPIQ